MPTRRTSQQRHIRRLGIAALVLSLAHVPLPTPDYHNVRHHDGPGQVCEYHDHLLRWHPDALGSADVAMLHWHWFSLAPGKPDTADHGGAPVLHSSGPDWSPFTWEDGPRVLPGSPSRTLDRPSPEPPGMASLLLAVADASASTRAGPEPIRSFATTFSARVSITSLLQRRLC